MTKKLLLFFTACLIFFAGAIFITYPLIFHLGDMVSGLGDELLIAYISSWVIHALTHNPIQLFNAPNFFPYASTLAYSETFISSSVLFSLPALLIGQPIAYQNISLIFSLVLLGLCVYLLTFYLTTDWLASLLTGIFVMFSPVILDKYIHLQVLFVFFVPLAILLFFQFIKTKQIRFLIVTMICFVLQTYNSFLPGYFILFSLIIIFVTYWCIHKTKVKLLINTKNIGIFIISMLLVVPLALPYYSVSKKFGYTRDIRDAIHFAIQPEDLLYSNQFTKLAPFFDELWQRASYPDAVSFKNGYPGLVLGVLIIASMFYLKKYWKKQTYEIKSLVFIAITGLVLSLGPFMHIGRATIHHPFPIPLPYALFYCILPGFNGMRNSARWEVLGIIAIAVVVGVILHTLLLRVSLIKKALIYASLLLIIFFEFSPSIHFVKIPQKNNFPKEYFWLADQPKNIAYIEMPIYNWNMFPYGTRELLRQYYNTVNFRRSVNGGSGFAPPVWQEKTFWLNETFPSLKSISYLKQLGVRIIIVHTNEYDLLHRDGYKIGQTIMPESSQVIQILMVQPGVSLEKKFLNTVIFTIK